MHELLKSRTYLGEKLFFNFLGTDFLAPKSGHRREKRPVLGPEGIRVGMRGMGVAILGMQEMRGIRVRMRGMEVGMRGFRVGIWGIRVRIQGIRVILYENLRVYCFG